LIHSAERTLKLRFGISLSFPLRGFCANEANFDAAVKVLILAGWHLLNV
jgi:hypothetical protein